MSQIGFVYILGNEYMPDLIKIGCTERAPWARADEISKATGVPVNFQVWCYAEFEDFQKVERDMHKWCAEHRVNPQREFFHGCIPYAVSLLWFHPDRLSFTDATAGRQAPFDSELKMRACPEKHQFYFDDLRNPWGDASAEDERADRQKRIADGDYSVWDHEPESAPIVGVVPELDGPASGGIEPPAAEAGEPLRLVGGTAA